MPRLPPVSIASTPSKVNAFAFCLPPLIESRGLPSCPVDQGRSRAHCDYIGCSVDRCDQVYASGCVRIEDHIIAACGRHAVTLHHNGVRAEPQGRHDVEAFFICHCGALQMARGFRDCHACLGDARTVRIGDRASECACSRGLRKCGIGQSEGEECKRRESVPPLKANREREGQGTLHVACATEISHRAGSVDHFEQGTGSDGGECESAELVPANCSDSGNNNSVQRRSRVKGNVSGP